MTEQDLEQINPDEIIPLLEKAIDDEPEYFHFIPISAGVEMAWQYEELHIPLICLMAKKFIRNQISGMDYEETSRFFIEHLRLEEVFVNQCSVAAYHASQVGADIADELISYEEGVSKLKEALDPNHELAEPLLEMTSKLIDEMSSMTITDAINAAIAEVPEDSDQNRQCVGHKVIAEHIFGAPEEPMVILSLAVAQDYIDKPDRDEAIKDLAEVIPDQAEELVDFVISMINSPEGPWEIAVPELQKLSALA